MTKINDGYTHFPMDFAYTQYNVDGKENVSKTSKETHQMSSNDPYDLDLTILNHSLLNPNHLTDTDTKQGTYGCPSPTEACYTQGNCTVQGTHGCNSNGC